MHPHHHAQTSVKLWGGKEEDYLPIHNWLDRSKELVPNYIHRAVSHHSHGIFECERVFGVTIKNSNGRDVPVRYVAEQHVKEDCGHVPSLEDWLKCIKPEPWMAKGYVGTRIEKA
jgi:hypothetical protein